MRQPLTPVLFVLFSLCNSASCGTAVFDHVVEVRVADPTGRLGVPPIEVSIFDKQSGQSEEWAHRTIGKAGPNSPYVGKVWSTATKTIFDSSLPKRVEMGLAVPAYESRGYFVLALEPAAGEEQRVTAAFAPYGAYFADANSEIVPLPLRVRSEKGKKGWLIHVTIDVPPRSRAPESR